MIQQRINVGLGESKVAIGDDMLIAIGLGSCIAVVAYDGSKKVGGLAHVVLPDGRSGDNDPGARYAESGVSFLLGQMQRQGSPISNLRVEIAGGAAVLSQSDTFNIGTRNVEAVRRALSAKGVRIAAEDTGGTFSRTVELEVATGRTVLHQGDRRWLLGAPPTREAAPRPVQQPKQGGVLLVVDDSDFVRTRCRTILGDNGYTVIEATNGAEAVAAYQRAHPRGVFLDITMPIKDGLTALAEIRAGDARARVAMMTTADQQAGVINALRLGACDFVAKPFQAERLLELAGKLIAA